MELGETIEINGEIWIACIDHSTKRKKMFELWTKEGKRMAYSEVQEC